MEIIIIPVIAAALLLILGVSGITLLKLLYFSMLLILLLMTVFFIGCAILALTCKRGEAELSRFEKHDKFDTAVYISNGEEYRNIFPAENILRDKIYSPGVRKILLKSGRRPLAVDRHSLVIIISGLILSPLSFAITYVFLISGITV